MGWILGGGGERNRFWERRISLWKRGGGIFWKEEVDSGSVTLYKTRYILGGRGRLWECRIGL